MPLSHRISKTPHYIELTGLLFPDNLPQLPPLPAGFNRWVYRGVKWASKRAIMVTSWDETGDETWDPPMMFQTRGDDCTHYIEAIIDHHWVCKCSQCHSVTGSAPLPLRDKAPDLQESCELRDLSDLDVDYFNITLERMDCKLIGAKEIGWLLDIDGTRCVLSESLTVMDVYTMADHATRD